MISVTVKLNPSELAVNSAFRAGKGRVRKSEVYANARAKVGEAIMLAQVESGLETITGPVAITVRWYKARTHKTGPAAGLPFGDVDGPIKGALDAVEDSGMIADDAQVVKVICEKRKAKLGKDRITLQIRAIDA